jgi:hypothetical protein
VTHLDTLRAIVARDTFRTYNTVDEDLSVEAGMDGNLARLLQAARILDREATNHPPGSMLRWFGFDLGFSCEGPDLYTVRAVLGLRPGWLAHVEPHNGEALDVVVDRFEQDDDPAAGFPVFLVGNRYDDGHSADNDYRGEPVRIPLAGARITVY